jgi:hypothetical protein
MSKSRIRNKMVKDKKCDTMGYIIIAKTRIRNTIQYNTIQYTMTPQQIRQYNNKRLQQQDKQYDTNKSYKIKSSLKEVFAFAYTSV